MKHQQIPTSQLVKSDDQWLSDLLTISVDKSVVNIVENR
uniref:Uncharacterized protein n=1 Tax=Methylophaga nitratireducenticrescens TaxID=754476 RepID=I1XHY4_METNJ